MNTRKRGGLGLTLIAVILWPLARRTAPNDDVMTPLPKDEHTPPMTKMYFIGSVSGCNK